MYMFLNETEVQERIERCNKLNLCYITLRRLEDTEDVIIEMEYNNIKVKVFAKYIYI